MSIVSSDDGSIQCIGTDHPNGTYIMRIALREKIDLAFGRFKKGKIIHLKRGHYVYIGSALAKRGSTTLGNRLRRHTSKSGGRAHKIQKELLAFFDSIGIKYTKRPAPKKLFWNIDHLLDLDSCEIIGIIFIRDPQSLENTWSEFMENLTETHVFEKGLGANDSKGHTHLQLSRLSDIQWKTLAYQLPTNPHN